MRRDYLAARIQLLLRAITWSSPVLISRGRQSNFLQGSCSICRSQIQYRWTASFRVIAILAIFRLTLFKGLEDGRKIQDLNDRVTQQRAPGETCASAYLESSCLPAIFFDFLEGHTRAGQIC